MRGITKAAVAAAVLSTTSPAFAATYIFESDDWSEGATFNGRFSVKNVIDTSPPYQFFTFDLTQFHAQFSGNSFVGPLTFDLSDVVYFDYAFDGAIGEDRSYDDPELEYGHYDSLNLRSEFGSFYIGSGDCHLGVDCGAIVDFRRPPDAEYWWGSDENSSPLRVTAVPEPATWALLLLGFGTIGAAFRRKKGVARVAYSF